MALSQGHMPDAPSEQDLGLSGSFFKVTGLGGSLSGSWELCWVGLLYLPRSPEHIHLPGGATAKTQSLGLLSIVLCSTRGL